jgi:DNA-directed RNA polymerase subunit RPC12/RpoP
VLVAGVDKDARAPVEVAVRRAFAERGFEETWSVSLVQLGGAWSVTLSGPGERFKHLSFIAEPQRLEERIREVISGDASHPEPATSPPTPGRSATQPGRSRVQDRHVCGKCRKELLVSYEGQADEPKEEAPVACPHCWAVIHVPIGAWAVVGGDYRADKL